MKKLIAVILITIVLFSSCSNDDENSSVNLKFTHYWNDTEITNQDFNQLKFVNENGETVSIERLRYLISNINLVGNKSDNLIDVGENYGELITITDLSAGSQNISFRFGFADEDNIDGAYRELNTANFNVPGMLGGGYHFMQFDGKYLNDNNEEAGFNYHVIRAVNRSNPDNLIFQDTSFEVNLGTVEIKNNTTIEIRVNIAEWFKNPNTWNLNELNTVLMPNFEAQKMMSANGKNVFSLGEVTN